MRLVRAVSLSLENLPVILLPAIALIVLLAAAVVILILRWRSAGRLNRRLAGLTSAVSGLEGRDISLRDSIGELILADDPDAEHETARAWEQYVSDSSTLYLDKWMAAPDDYFTASQLLEPADWKLLATPLGGLAAMTGLLLSLIQFIVLASTGQLDPAAGLIALLPAAGGLFFAVIIHIQKLTLGSSLQYSAAEWCRALERHLPIYSERAGSALLVDEFMQYDRKMAGAVEELSDIVSGLVENDLADAVSASINETMTEQIAPGFRQASQALTDLATTFAEREEKQMEQLATGFADRLNSTLEERLAPLSEAVSQYIAQLTAGQDQLQLALTVMETYKQESGETQDRLMAVLDTFAEQRTIWEGEQHQVTQSLTSLAETSDRLSALQAGSEENLAARIGALAESLGRFTDDNQALIERTEEAGTSVQAGFTDSSLAVKQMLEQAIKANQRLLGEYKHLTQDIAAASDQLELNTSQLAQRMDELNRSLEQSVGIFTNQLQSSVTDTLNEFDSGLAEVSLRLSHTTTEINDTAARISRSIEDGDGTADE